MRRNGLARFLGVVFACCSALAWAQVQYDDPTPTLELGAKVYGTRCVLCHGNKAMGEGILPMRLKEYPNTSLLTARLAQTREDILKVTVLGPHFKGASSYMPPFGKELSWSELESVSDFVALLRTDKTKAYGMLETLAGDNTATRKLGRQVYATRCVLCHGEFGEGDGRMSRLLKDPPPADLTASRIPEVYLKDIIIKGGEAMGRSKHMPPWGDQLSGAEISSLVLYIISIRD